MEICFNGRRALVTGAGKGIGREVAKSLARCGAETIALSRTQSDLDSLREEFPDMKTVCVDLNHWEETRSALEKLGPIDLLVNNAGTNSLAPFLEVTEEEIDSIFRVNFKAAFHVAQVVAKNIVSRGVKGAIVNVSSQASMTALENHSVYCSTKGALDALTKVMALELGPKQIRVNAVNPTVTWTDLAAVAWSDPEKGKPMLSRIPVHRFATVNEVADVILFLLSDKASMINGVRLPVDGGATAC